MRASTFAEFEKDSDKPSAYNFELAYFPTESTQLAIRMEHSSELADQPKQQYGIAATWLPRDNFNITIEYLHGKFKNGFVNELEEHNLIVVLFSLEL